MLEELKQRSNKLAAIRLLVGTVGVVGFFLLCRFNVLEWGSIIGAWPWFVPGFCGLAAIGVVWTCVEISRGSVTKGIEKFCQKTQNPDSTMVRLERTWRHGVDFTEDMGRLGKMDFKTCRMDSEYIIFAKLYSSKVLTLKNAVWVWQDVDQVKGFIHVKLMVYYENGKLEQLILFTSHRAADKMIEYILEHCPYIAVGHNKETERLYKDKNMAGFKEYAIVQRGH
jgi:hypothetical protein